MSAATAHATATVTTDATASAASKTCIFKWWWCAENARETLEAHWQRYMTTSTEPVGVYQVFLAHHCTVMIALKIGIR